MKAIVRFLIFIGLNCSFGAESERSEENDQVGLNHNYDKRKIQNLREALLAFDEDSLQKLLKNANLSSSDVPLTTPAPEINSELIDIVKDDTIGNFDQITIERDDEGAIVVTKTKRVFADGRKHTHKAHTPQRAETPTKPDSVQLKNSPIPTKNQTNSDEEEVQQPESASETDENAFIQNEQLITICLAALGVTSTGLLMWIAIQHLYGIYTDFKKTINPMSYHDSNYSDEYECTSVISARMADRPPTYDHSVSCDPYMQRHSIPAPPYMGPSTSEDHRYETGSLDLNTQQQMSYNSHHGTPSGQQPYGDSDTSSWESDDEPDYQPPAGPSSLATTSLNAHNSQVERVDHRTVSLGNPCFDDANAQLQRRFALRRRMERFRRYRRQSANAIQCSPAEAPVENVTEDPSQVIQVPNFRSFSQPARNAELTEPEPPDDTDRLSTNSAPPVEHDFESAPELAELDILHHILSQTNSRTQPRRTTSFASYVDRKVDQNGSIVSVMNVQIEIEVPTSSTCRVEEIPEEQFSI